MLRDSKLNFAGISTAARAAVIGMVLLVGVFAAGLRGPGQQGLARAEETANTTTRTSLAPSESRSFARTIDLSFVSPDSSMLIILRPAEALARPDLAPWAKLLDQTPEIAPTGRGYVEFRQITIMGHPTPGRPSDTRDVMVFQAIEPLAASSVMRDRKVGATPRDIDGKRLYLGKNGRQAALQYDDRTVILAGSERVIRAYLASDLGALPRWLAKGTWDSFRDDHVVYAFNTTVFRLTLRAIAKHAPEGVNTAFTMFSPLWDDSTCVIAGLHVGDSVRAHAVAFADNEGGAKTIQKTVEAARVLGLNVIKSLQEAQPTGQKVTQSLFIPSLNALKIDREGTTVRAESSVALDTILKMLPPIMQAKATAERARSLNNLRTLAIAMHNYYDAHKRFPPAVLYGPDGKTPYSWRVAILPYIEQGALYKQYHFDEPWDSPANRKVLAKMPADFRSPTEPAGSTNACYFALTGPGTVFDGRKGMSFREIEDGTSDTLLLVEAKRDIPWTKPEDIPYDPKKPLPKLGGFFDGLFNLALTDGSVRTLPTDVPEKLLRALTTRNGGERINADDLRYKK